MPAFLSLAIQGRQCGSHAKGRHHAPPGNCNGGEKLHGFQNECGHGEYLAFVYLFSKFVLRFCLSVERKQNGDDWFFEKWRRLVR